MKTFQDFYEKVGDQESIMVDLLREIILETEPNFREKISYGVPYYFLNSRVCFIWPAAVKWGPKKGVLLGFCKGAHLDDFDDLLNTEGRKEIGTITYLKPDEIQADKIKELIFQALLVDKEIESKHKK